MSLHFLIWRDGFSTTEVSTHVFGQYRFAFDIQRPSHVVWQPYTSNIISTLLDYCIIGDDIWRTMSPLICFHIVEWHRPYWVLHQFGMKQHILESCDTNIKLHCMDLQGRHDLDWSDVHKEYIEK